MKGIFVAILFTYLLSLGTSANIDKSLILEKYMNNPKELFKAYYTLFNKDAEYDINSEQGVSKYKVFKDNVNYIKEENAKRGVQVLGITQFTDLTVSEFEEKYLMKEKYHIKSKRNKNNLEKPDFSAWSEIDHRPKMNPAKNQGACGSCWAFGTVAAVEGNYNLNFGTLYNLSEQYVIDCDDIDNGCLGGYAEQPLLFMMQNGVFTTEQKPYIGFSGQICRSELKKSALNIVTSFGFCPQGLCTENQWFEQISKGPVAVMMNGSFRSLANYKPSSIDIPWIPEGSCNWANHIVSAVGVKMIDGSPHVIVRNSWGLDWGYEGHFTIPANNSCVITEYAYLPKVQEHKPAFTDDGALLTTNCDRKKFYRISEGEPDFISKFGGTVKDFAASDSFQNLAFFTEKNCTGKVQLVDQYSGGCFATNPYIIAPEFKSVSLYKPYRNNCIWFYEKQCGAGRWARLCGENADLVADGLDLNFEINSILFGGIDVQSCGLMTLVLHDDVNFNGKTYSMTFKSVGYTNLDDYPDFKNFVRTAKSISFIKKPGNNC
jgi:hypothetical protein